METLSNSIKVDASHDIGHLIDPAAQDDERRSVLRHRENPAPRSSLGYAGEVYAVDDLGGNYAVDLALPIDQAVLRKRQIDRASLRLFRWSVDEQTFRIVPGAFPKPEQAFVSAKINRPGLYTLIGLSSNPWVSLAIDLLDDLSEELPTVDELQSARHRICELMLCRSGFDDIMGGYRQSHYPGPPPLPDHHICEDCRTLILREARLPEFDIIRERYRPPSASLVSFQQWIDANPALANAIVWHRPRPHQGAPQSYPNWRQNQKEELARAFWCAFTGYSFGLPVTPPVDLLTTSVENLVLGEALDQDLAWDFYTAYVAQSLALEFAGRVPWTLLDYSDTELQGLLDSGSLFEYEDPYDHDWNHGYIIFGGSSQNSQGTVTPSDPVDTYQWLMNNIPLRDSARDTIVELLHWCQQNLSHYSGGPTRLNHQAHWQYEGWAPVMQILEGSRHPRQGCGHWTAGCWGTTGLLRALLRTINIPVALVQRCGHALPHFMHQDLYLSHGDDPYGTLDGIPIDRLLIDGKQFVAWFNGANYTEEACSNVARQPIDLAIKHLPLPLLQRHCEDTANGRNHTDSKVFDYLSVKYDLKTLEKELLWARIEEKIDDCGGCGNLPGQ